MLAQAQNLAVKVDNLNKTIMKGSCPISDSQAYHRPQSSAVQVAKIVAVTVVIVSVVLGAFILASAYVQANASCRQLEQELELLSEAADRFQPPPQAEALIQVSKQLRLYHQEQPPEN